MLVYLFLFLVKDIQRLIGSIGPGGGALIVSKDIKSSKMTLTNSLAMTIHRLLTAARFTMDAT